MGRMWLFCKIFNNILMVALLYKIVTAQVFHQDDYTVKPERAQVIDYNRSYAKHFKLELAWHNRTTRIINGVIDLLLTLTNYWRGEIQVYKLLSNEYRFFPISLNLSMCAELRRNFCSIKEMLINHSNLTLCPIKPGLYHVRNAMFDFSQFPPYIPSGSYKVTVKFYHKLHFVAELDMYGVVQTILKKWEN